MTPAEHLAVWRAAASKVARAGVDVDAATKDCSRFWYLPGRYDAQATPAVGWLPGEPVDVDRIVAWSRSRETRREDIGVATVATSSLASGRRAGAYAQGALRLAAQVVATAGKGTRNATLVRQSFCIGGLVGAGQLDARDAAEVLHAAAVAAGLTKHEAIGVIERGLAAGAKKPRCA
jgi:hypothetical protein